LKTFKRLLVSAGLPLMLLTLVACDDRTTATEENSAPAPKLTPVVVETVSRQDLKEVFTLPAGLEAWEDLIISAELSGPVDSIHFQEGEAVPAGKVLVEIDSRTIGSMLTRDRSEVEVLKGKLARYQQLLREGLVSQQEVDDLRNRLTAAEAALQMTGIQLANSRPVAPVSGLVDRLYVDRGEYVEKGKPILRLVQIDKLKAIASVPEKDVPFLRRGQEVQLSPAEILTNEVTSVSGIIDYIAYAADETTRTYRTRIILDNGGHMLRPGMIVRARFVRRELDQVISVPLYALIDKDGDKSVFVVDGDVAREASVTLAGSVADRVVISQGLSPGQRVIVKGQQLLVDGAGIIVGEP